MADLTWRRVPWRRLSTLAWHGIRYELRLYRSLLRWVTRRPDLGGPDATHLTYARTPTPVIWLWIFGSACEIPLVHVLVPWEWLRVSLLVVGVWGLVWMVGFLASLWVYPHLVTPTELRVRNGPGHDVRVPWSAIESVTTRRRDLESSVWALQPRETPRGTDLQVGLSGQVNVHVALREPTTVTTAKGPMTVSEVSFFADEPREAAALIRQRVDPVRLADHEAAKPRPPRRPVPTDRDAAGQARSRRPGAVGRDGRGA